MQRLKHEIELKISNHPWWAIGLCSSVVFVIAMMLNGTSPAPRNAIPGFKEGFIIVLSTSRLLDPTGDLQLRGNRVQLLHREPDSAPCRSRHPPLSFSANERTMTLAGSLEEIEATVLALTSEDLKHVAFALPGDTSVQPCTNSVKIVYGPEG